MLLTILLLTQAITPPPRPNPSDYLLIKYYRASDPAPFKPVGPNFPDELRKAVQVTMVVVRVVSDREGRVVRATILEGDAKAHDAALRAAIQWSIGHRDGELPEPVKLFFVFRTLPAGTPSEELATVFHGPIGVEVRAAVIPDSSHPPAEAPPQ